MNIDPIPFGLLITKDNNTKFILSNTYYFEITIGSKRFRNQWVNECISIGYGDVKTNYKVQVGWTNKSWGFHSDDGNFVNNNYSKPFSQPWGPNDTVGVGLTYLSLNRYLIFLIKNGVMVKNEMLIETECTMSPMIGLDSSYPIKVNLGKYPYQFDIENYIKSHEILSSTNSYLNSLEDMNNLLYSCNLKENF